MKKSHFVLFFLFYHVAACHAETQQKSNGIDFYYKYIKEIQEDIKHNFNTNTKCKPDNIKYFSNEEMVYVLNIKINNIKKITYQNEFSNHPNVNILSYIDGRVIDLGLFLNNGVCIGFEVGFLVP